MQGTVRSIEEVRRKLLKEMKGGMFSTEKRLPRETVLSEQLGISRTLLRDVLAGLEREGFITRKHGVGTIINHHVLDICHRMDIETEFFDIIRQNGYEPSIGFIRVSEETADEKTASKLNILPGDTVVCICLLCCADGRPVIFCRDMLDKKLVKTDYREQEHQMIIFSFLRKFCDVNVYMDLTEIHPVLADCDLAAVLDIPEGTPLLNMEETDYDIMGNPVFYSRQYFVDAYIKHTVLRKKI